MFEKSRDWVLDLFAIVESFRSVLLTFGVGSFCSISQVLESLSRVDSLLS